MRRNSVAGLGRACRHHVVGVEHGWIGSFWPLEATFLVVRVVMVATGPIDGVLGLWLLNWMGVSNLTASMGGLLLGIMSMLFVQPLVLPQRLLVWRLEKHGSPKTSITLVAGLVIVSHHHITGRG